MEENNKIYLNVNKYDCIVIRKIEDIYEVIAHNKETKKTKDYLNYICPYEQIYEIINDYLLNNVINSIHKAEYLKEYYNEYLTVRSVNNNLIALFLDDEVKKIVFDKIIKKYYSDRNNYCFNNDIKEIHSSSNYMRYGDTLVLCTEYDKWFDYDAFTDYDDEFMEKVLLYKLDHINYASIVFETVKDDNGLAKEISYLVNKNLKIALTSIDVLNYVYKQLHFYNSSLKIEENKKLTLRK